jgi:hypothetical protein
MSKYTDVSKDYQDKFDNLVLGTSIPEWIKFKVLNCLSAKYPVKLFKANEITNYLTNVEIVVIINEEFLDKLGDDKAVNILFEEELVKVMYDSEKDKINILNPDYVTFKSMQNKYGEELTRAKELVDALIRQQEEEEKERKQQLKESKKKGK